VHRSSIVVTTRVLLGALLHACAGGLGAAVLEPHEVDAALARYEQAPHPDELVRIAEAVLERELVSDDAAAQRAALAALAGAGTHGRELLERVADDDSQPSLRVHALGLLARMGDEAARLAVVRHLAASNPELRAEAITGVDPMRDPEVLVRALRAPWGQVRLAAARALANARPDDAVRLALSEVARRDTRHDVRAAALNALAGQGGEAVAAIEARLRDEEPSVRTAAIAALVRLDAPRALAATQAWLAGGPSPEGIDAARLLIAQLGSAAPNAARDHIERALASPAAELRGQAASALSVLDDADAAAMAAQRVDVEAVVSVRLLLALRLATGDPRTAALTELLKADDVVASQAAIALASTQTRSGIERVLALRSSKLPTARAIIARALARQLDRAHDARTLLRDPEASVRIATAAAILSGA
jgi:SWI/SNF-related matrix-associated actin-dependent regulator 1 of chromatin subfamily A